MVELVLKAVLGLLVTIILGYSTWIGVNLLSFKEDYANRSEETARVLAETSTTLEGVRRDVNRNESDIKDIERDLKKMTRIK